jgi:pyruvate dehydrogenase E2 component (dihydrolipoamide acetyltransferase)
MKVELPFLAEGIEGGDVVLVLVHEGDQVSEGQALVELETDKATVPVPSPTAGKVLRLLVREGDHVKVGAALVELEAPEEPTRQARPASPQPSPPPPPSSSPAAEQAAPVKETEEREGPSTEISSAGQQETEPPMADSGRAEPAARTSSPPGLAIPASPSVRRLARELGVDLTQVKGSESGGRITAEDVKTFVRERTGRSGDVSIVAHDTRRVFTTVYGNERCEPLPSLRRKIAANVTQSWTTIPHVHQFHDADITELMALHKRYAPEFKKRGATLTLTSFFLKVVVHALKLHPQLNATLNLDAGEVIYKEYYNIGVAVDTPAGLIVPVVHNVDRKDLFQISVELADLADRTRKREIKLEELRGATFTVSNMGGLGAGPFTPIINPPQVGILGVGKARITPVYRDGQFVPRRVLTFCVAYDHRLVDGAVGARFTNEIAKALEDFQATFLGL